MEMMRLCSVFSTVQLSPILSYTCMLARTARISSFVQSATLSADDFTYMIKIAMISMYFVEN